MNKMGKHESGRAVRFSAGALTAALPKLWTGSPAIRAFGQALVYFLLALLLARGVIAGHFAPLGVSFVAAVSCRRGAKRVHAAAALFGAMLGYALAGGSLDWLKYCAACALCFTAGMVFRGAPVLRARWFASAAAGASLALTLLVYVAGSAADGRAAAVYVCELALSAAAAYCYRPLTALLDNPREAKTERPPNFASPPDRAERLACLAAAGVSLELVLCAMPQVFGMSPGRLAAVFACLCLSAMGPMYGCVCGLVSGLAVGLALGTGVPTAVSYAISALTAGFFLKFGLFWVALAFTLANAALLPWLWPAPYLYAFLECFASGVLFYLFYPRLRAHTEGLERALAAAPSRAQEKKLASTVRGKLIFAARAFSEAAQDAAASPPVQEKNEDLYTLALERVCRGCAMAGACYRASGDLTRQALEEARAKIQAAGRARPEDFPPFFAARCQKLTDFVSAVNEHLALRESRARYRRRARDDAALLQAQYGAVSRFLEETAQALAPKPDSCEKEKLALRHALAASDIALTLSLSRENGRYACIVETSASLPRTLRRRLEALAGETLGRTMRFVPAQNPGEKPRLCEAPALSLRAAVSAEPKEGESDCGDKCVWLRTMQGKDYFILSDGMGAGADAARESGRFLSMLEKFLRAGVEPETALRLIHPAYTIRCGGDSFTTCDILCADLYSGAAVSYKCGAAPTYLCPSGSMPRKICSVSLPVGLPADAPSAERTAFDLRAGDTVLMLSDGLCSEDDRWLLTLLAENRAAKPDVLCALVMEKGKSILGLRDDCTVLAVRVGAAEKESSDV